MYVRLAFAVAAHLEPEILIVDEVLAVGDAQFQAKCLGKMQDVARSGARTVLFVSHNMAAVNALCTKALLLQRGTLIASGSTEAIIDQYLAGGGSEDGAVYRGDPGVIRSGVALLEARVVKADGSTSSILECRDRFDIQISYQVHEPCRGVRVGYRLESVDGTIVCGANDGEQAETRTFQPGRYEVTCALGALNLNSGSYTLTVGVDLPPYQQALFLETHCLRFSVEDTAGTGAGFGRPPGVIRPSAQWQIQDLT
jgi:lipopolysaccharide transport system ATP-binding protein